MAAQDVVLQSLDQALAAHVGKLFGVLVSQSDPTAHDRCLAGVRKAVETYEALKTRVEDGTCLAEPD